MDTIVINFKKIPIIIEAIGTCLSVVKFLEAFKKKPSAFSSYPVHGLPHKGLSCDLMAILRKKCSY